MPPDEFENDAEKRMYQVLLAGDAYMEDNKKVYLKLKEYLVETEGGAWIETFDRSQDGRAAYQSWTDHYNGAGKLDKHTQHAKAETWLPASWLKRIFSRVGAMQEWSCPSEAKCVHPPCASISLSRLLFMECDAVSKVLEDYLATMKPAPVPKAMTTPATPSPALARSALPSVTPGAQTEEPANTVSTSLTPMLDSFVGSRDKGDKKKLDGVLLETVSTLAPGRDHRTIPVTSTNGKQSLITVVPQCNSTDGLIETNCHSGWMDNIIRHCIAPGGPILAANAVGMHLAKNHEEDFMAVAQDVLGLQTTNTMGTIECKAMIQDSNITFNQFSTVRRHVCHATGNSFQMSY